MTSPSSSVIQTSARKDWLLLHVSFVLIGVITTLLGPILPFFIHHWSLTDAQAGLFFTTQYFGSSFGVALTSVVLSRYGFSKVTAAGFIGFVLGFVFLGVGPWMLAALMISIIGIGYGLSNPAINLRGTQLPSKNIAAAVTLLNFSWTIGAVLCPFLVGPLIPAIGLRRFCLALAAASVVLVGLHIYFRAPAPNRAARSTHSMAEWLAHIRVPQAIPLLMLFFLYVGVEVALGGWIASFEKRMPGKSAATLMMAPSVYYGFLLLGRGIAPLALRRFEQVRISTGGLAVATIGALVITFSEAPRALYLGAALAGFGLAPQYPIFVTWLAAIFREDANWIGALFFGSAGLGGGAIPGLVGFVSARTDSLRAGLYVPLAITFLMLFLVLRAQPYARRT
jgi:FHS family glucose/mannose:H+ symporter-like MFS transporter